MSSKCFLCHGPDEATREAGLRLDVADDAQGDLGGYAAIVPFDPTGSEAISRVMEEDPDLKMPPPSSNKSLTPEEIETLRAWIEGGAAYEPHWSFVHVRRPEPPSDTGGGWARNEIDRFVLAAQRERGLQPSPEADRHELIRRVSLDLTGLPPTPEEADAFVSDTRPDAYERVVARLLASPHYGEQWARRWLDLARYSDTNGYEKDNPREMWLYRDWVINALNSDTPFDRFTVEQLAGDLLPSPTIDQRIATGFHRNTMVNEEGGIDPQEFRYQAVVDRVSTTGAAWLGMTLGCAQCHTHKFDPVTHVDYFGVFALFNNADEPTIAVERGPAAANRAEGLSRIGELRRSIADRFPVEGASAPEPSASREAAELGFSEWIDAECAHVVEWAVARPERVSSNLATVEVLDDASVLVGGDVTKDDTYQVAIDLGGCEITAIRLEALPHDSLPAGGPGRQTIPDDDRGGVGNFFLSEITARVVPASRKQKRADSPPIVWGHATASYSPPGIEASFSIDGKHDTGWSVYGRSGRPHEAVFPLANPLRLGPDERLEIELRHEQFYPAGLGRFRVSTTSAPLRVTRDSPPTLPARGHSNAVAATLRKPRADWSIDERRSVWERFLEVAPQLRAERDRLATLEASLPATPTALVMAERPRAPRVTRRHHRGEYLQPREVVEPRVPEALPALPADRKPDRLAFAQWLVDPGNPLTARVVANRQWQALFGRGIVRTTEDFGLQGEHPTHPELLDWLASEFMDGRWSLKSLHRTIVTSATYRQASHTTDDALAQDPENRWLARAPRLRVDAEGVRDVVLAASGLLTETVGGPSVFPPQPTGVTENAYGPLLWSASTGADRYRRGLYAFNKRTAPYAAFAVFDAPSGEVCITRRERSNTPLQSLAVLNDEVVAEAARNLALECVARSADPTVVAQSLLRRCVTRTPATDEVTAVVEFWETQRRRFAGGELDPQKVLNTGPRIEWVFDGDDAGWQARNHTTLEPAPGGLRVVCDGDDPFIGVSVDGPSGPVALDVRGQFPAHGVVEVFWTTSADGADSAERKAAFRVAPGPSQSNRVSFVPQEPLRSLRLDFVPTKPGAPQVVLLESVRLAAGDGLFEAPPGVDLIDLASWQLAARAALNLDETITRP
ncbi:MAG: PSD1 and planctomycete cytochrome C domain-containing protein [Lacipirellulaceae bacterium]